jgi:type I restriction-modification system DNA methylase subunit
MTQQDQKQLGRTLWNIADQLRGAMSADDFCDYMLSFLFLRHLSDNYVEAIKNLFKNREWAGYSVVKESLTTAALTKSQLLRIPR